MARCTVVKAWEEGGKTHFRFHDGRTVGWKDGKLVVLSPDFGVESFPLEDVALATTWAQLAWKARQAAMRLMLGHSEPGYVEESVLGCHIWAHAVEGWLAKVVEVLNANIGLHFDEEAQPDEVDAWIRQTVTDWFEQPEPTWGEY